MSNLGSWDVNVSIGSMPEKVATAVSAMNDQLVGAEYSPIAYLGSKVVNGVNHAVLAKQTILSGKDIDNVVLLIFNEKGNDCTLANIERIIESSEGVGTPVVNVEVAGEINKSAQALFDKVFGGFCGSIVEPIALLATEMSMGTNYIFACEVSPVLTDNDVNNKNVSIVRVNDMTESAVDFVDLLKSNIELDAVDSARRSLRISSPWVLFYREVCALFSKDSQIKILFNEEEPELKIWVKGDDEKAAALGRFVPKVRVFGNITLNISVVGDDGQEVPDINCDDQSAIEKAFNGNEAVSYIRKINTVFGDTIMYVVFQREVVQYFADNMFDLHGVISTIYEDIADDIFGDTIGSTDLCSFCTDVE